MARARVAWAQVTRLMPPIRHHARDERVAGREWPALMPSTGISEEGPGGGAKSSINRWARPGGLGEEVVLAGDDDVGDVAVAAGEGGAADDGDGAAGGLAEGELGG